MNIWPLPRITFRQLSTVRETRPTALITNAAAWANVRGQIELPLEIQAEPANVDKTFLEGLGNSMPSKIGVLYAIGSDTIINAAKVIASVSHRPLVVVPTAFSSDVPYTSSALVQVKNGFEDYETGAPEEVIINWSIITEADVSDRGTGIVEVLSSVTALLDWRLAATQNQTTPETRLSQWGMQVAAALSMQAVKAAPQIGQGSAEALRGLLELLCMSVQLNSVLGHSRATMGTEHIFADAIQTTENVTHAEKVAAGILFALALHNQDVGPLKTALEQAGLRTHQIPAPALRAAAERSLSIIKERTVPYCILHESDHGAVLKALDKSALIPATAT
jgi:glycerol dehydrogenase-like iron-containing ADH family enzyme